MVAPIKLVLTRQLRAMPEQVFDAWLDPFSFCRWLFATPGGVTMVAEADARTGGQFRIAEQRGAVLAEHIGQYVQIARPSRLVFSFATDREQAPSTVVVELAAVASGTRLTLTHELDARWSAYEDRTRKGWDMVLDGLEATLADGLVLELMRIVAAPRALVWKVWTGPALSSSWGPEGYRVEYLTARPRVGEPWSARFVPITGGGVLGQGGVFLEIRDEARAMFTSAWHDEQGRPGPATVVCVAFEDVGANTRVVLRQAGFATAMARDGHAQGWSQALDAFQRAVVNSGKETKC